MPWVGGYARTALRNRRILLNWCAFEQRMYWARTQCRALLMRGGIVDAEQYRRWSEPLRRHAGALRALLAANKALTRAFYVMYPVLLVVLALRSRDHLVACVVIPAVAFCAVSAFRRHVNAPRPYEALAIDPLIRKDTTGCSFPSRHAFSSFLIAACWFSTSVWVGCVLLALAAAMAVVRVIGGVHFPRDVAVGALVGLLCGFAAACITIPLG